jgi:alpha-glucosidase
MLSATPSSAPKWWQSAVIYEIYPRSFQDSNGDGIGDLQGIISRLDYLKDLGVDAIWLTPIYPSPNVDFGYDVADYTAIAPEFGTMADFDKLMSETRARGIRVLMDMVLNHTSDKHPWFIESASSKTAAKRDWYVWNSGKMVNGKKVAPNNWQSIFGHSAWQPSSQTGDFYYHFFYIEQPDLNWRNPAVKDAMFGAVKFWLDKGVAGFRLDAIDTLFEVPGLPDSPNGPGVNAYGDPTPNFVNQAKQPEVHDVLRELRKVADSYSGDRLLVGEIYTKDTSELVPWYGTANDELHLPMDLHLVNVKTYDARSFREKLESAQTELGGRTPLLVTDNHDQPRSFDRWGRLTIPAVAAAVLGTRASALLYYGQELGMLTSTPTRKEDVKDPIGITGWPGEKGRDGERTPMQWDDSPSAGFSKGKPWLPVPESAKVVNVVAEKADKHSTLNWYRELLKLRHTNEALKTGATAFVNHDDVNVLMWTRTPAKGAAVVIAANMGEKPVTVKVDAKGLRALMVTDDALKSAKPEAIALPPYGVYIGELKK